MAVLEHEFGKSVFVEDAIIVTGSEAEIILKVYTSAETLDVIESVRKVVGVGGTVTYNVIGEVVLRKSLLGGV